MMRKRDKSMRKLLWAVGLGTGCLLAASVSFAAAPAAPAAPAKVDLARGQQLASTVCAACHGVDGNSPTNANPHLAGQVEQYLAAQLAAFKSKARDNAIMAGMVAGLSPDDMRSVAAFYAQQKATKPATARDAQLAKEGLQIYRAGIKKLDVPACAGCHAANGAGIPAQYPRVAGQWQEYTQAALKQYAREERKHPIMSAVAKRMSERQISAVSEYMAGLR